VNKPDSWGRTALQIACLENRIEVAKLLLRNGASANCRELDQGQTPLMTCIRLRHEEIGLAILQSAKDFKHCAQDNTGRTALMYSFFFGQYTVADCLLEKGASMTIRDMNGLTPYDIISEKLLTPGADRKFLKKYAKLCRPRQVSVALQSSLNAVTPRSPGRNKPYNSSANSNSCNSTLAGSTSSSRSESPSESGATSPPPASRAPSTASSGPCAEPKTSLMGVVRHPMNLFRTCKAK